MTLPNINAQPGDVWIFARKGFFNRLINIKTWSRFSHVEVVAFVNTPEGIDMVAARNGVGVGMYDPDPTGLALIVRPKTPFKRVLAMSWFFDRADGQKYDWLGLLNFVTAKTLGDNGKMFCSEFATRFLRQGGVDPFPGADADGVPPSWFAHSPVFEVVWRSPDEERRELERVEQLYDEEFVTDAALLNQLRQEGL